MLSNDDLYQNIGKRILEGIGGVLGGIGGATLGSLIPIPGVGTFLGGLGGNMAGRWLGGVIADNVDLKSFGKIAAELPAIGFKDELKAAGRPMATGGIVTAPTHALIGEAGPEAVIPLNKLSNIMNNQDMVDSNNNLLQEFKEMKKILAAILHKEGTITLNGTKMGTAMAVGSYKVQ